MTRSSAVWTRRNMTIVGRFRPHVRRWIPSLRRCAQRRNMISRPWPSPPFFCSVELASVKSFLRRHGAVWRTDDGSRGPRVPERRLLIQVALVILLAGKPDELAPSLDQAKRPEG